MGGLGGLGRGAPTSSNGRGGPGWSVPPSAGAPAPPVPAPFVPATLPSTPVYPVPPAMHSRPPGVPDGPPMHPRPSVPASSPPAMHSRAPVLSNAPPAIHPRPPIPASAPPATPNPLPAASLTQDQETAGELANYRRKVQSLEREVASLRSRAPPPSASADALRTQLTAALAAQKKAETRLSFLQAQVSSRGDDLAEGTQAPSFSQLPATQAPVSSPPDPPPRRRTTSPPPPPRAKRRRSGPPRPSSRDTRDWQTADAAWWAAYDEPDRAASRARAAAFAGPRAAQVLALCGARGGGDLRGALAESLAGGEDAWPRLAGALLSAAEAAPPGRAAPALAAAAQLHEQLPGGVGVDKAAAAAALGSLERGAPAGLALRMLAATGRAAKELPGKRAERALRDALAAGAPAAAAAAGSLAVAALRLGEPGVAAAERLAAAALDALPTSGNAFRDEALTLVERVATVAPFEVQRAPAILGALDEAGGARAARVVAGVGTSADRPAALARAVAVLGAKPGGGTTAKVNGDGGGPGGASGKVAAEEDGLRERSDAEVQALSRVMAAWAAFAGD